MTFALKMIHERIIFTSANYLKATRRKRRDIVVETISHKT